MSLVHVNLGILVLLVSFLVSTPFLPPLLQDSLSVKERDLMEKSHFWLRSLTLFMSGCEALYLFLSATSGSFSDDS